MELRQLLLNFKWNHRFFSDKSNVEIIIEFHNAPKVEKSIFFNQIKEIGKKFILIDIKSIPTYIPFHRIKLIRNIKRDEVFYQKKTK